MALEGSQADLHADRSLHLGLIGYPALPYAGVNFRLRRNTAAIS